MKEAKKSNYLGTKFALDNLKKDRKKIMECGCFKGFGWDPMYKDVCTKTYYDTPDFFFQNHGITINKNDYKGKSTSDLVVRYESEVKRIMFLSEFPDTFAIQIPAKDSIYGHLDFIAESISELIPSGLGVDVQNTLRAITPVVCVTKKREYYRGYHVSGLKVFVYFTQAEYSSPLAGRYRHKIDMVEIDSETISLKNEYDELIKRLTFSNPTLFELKHSDVLIGREYLFNMK